MNTGRNDVLQGLSRWLIVSELKLTMPTKKN